MLKRALSESSDQRTAIRSVKTCQRFTCNLPGGFGMLARIAVRSCGNVRAKQLGKDATPKEDTPCFDIISQ